VTYDARNIDGLIERAADEAARRTATKMLDEAAFKRAVTEAVEPAVEEAIKRTLSTFGVDASRPADLSRDFAFLRSQRETYAAATRHGLLVLIAAMISGILFAVWQALKAGGPR
jgi:hypothetical protein